MTTTAPTNPEAEDLTGEQLDMVAVQGEILMLQLKAHLGGGSSGPEDLAWLPVWYLARLAECDGVELKIKEQAKVLQTEVDARRKALAYHWGRGFKARVDDDLADQHGKKKSVNYAAGKAGYRKTKERLDILDDAAFISWAKMECPDCLEYRIARKGPATEHLKSTGEVPPGTVLVPAEDRFYPAIEQAALPDVPAHRRLHGEPSYE